MRIIIIKKIPAYTHYTPAYRSSIQIYQWPNGSYSLFIRRKIKGHGRVRYGMLVGKYFNIQKAYKAATKWYNKYCKRNK